MPSVGSALLSLDMRVILLIAVAVLSGCALFYEEDPRLSSEIRNETSAALEIVWTDAEGLDHRVATVDPGTTASMNTEVECKRSIQLIARTLAGTVIAIRERLCPEETWTIIEPPDPSGA